MSFLFAQNESNRYYHEVYQLQAAYRQAIRNNKEFSEVKKIYQELKRSRKNLPATIKNELDRDKKQTGQY
jgi:hypothetical protein